MRFRAVKLVPYANPRGIESSPGQQLVEVEAETYAEALTICALNHLRYVKPIVETEREQS